MSISYAETFAPDPAIVSRAKTPGMLLMIAAGVNMAMVVFQVAYLGFAGSLGMLTGQQMKEEDQIAMIVVVVIAILYGGFGALWNATIGYAGWKMQKLESYTLCMIGSILAIVPCWYMNACCLFSVPIGIYALVTMNDHQVKDNFRS